MLQKPPREATQNSLPIEWVGEKKSQLVVWDQNGPTKLKVYELGAPR